MKKIITILFEPEGRKAEVQFGISIFEVARMVGVGLRSECGGKGVCGKCKVIVPDKKSVSEVTEAERRHLTTEEIESGYRLACQALLKKSATIMIPEESRILARKIQVFGLERPVLLNVFVKKFHVKLAKPTLMDVRPDFERVLDVLKVEADVGELEVDYDVLKVLPETLRRANWDVTVALWNCQKIIAIEEGDTSDRVFGVAIDIGTSKIVGCLVDLKSGKTISTGFIENPQILYGEDIISRIDFAANEEKGLERLQKLVLDGINHVISYICAQASVNADNVYEATVVGNTAMHHFFLGINPKYTAFSPFTPAIKRPINVKAGELGIKICKGGNVHVLPIIAGFVGADAVADVLASGIHTRKEISLLLDIGTNTEIFVGNSEDILSCSCASGPAFEGAHIRHGMKAVTGAIEKISIDPTSGYEVKYKTIGDAAPLGICGSAIIDAVAEMLKCGIINSRGRFNLNVKTPRLRVVDGTPEFVLVWRSESGTGKEIVITQKDVGEVQLAKAAIFAGCWILMKRKNVKVNDIDQLLIAGAFGSYINPENAKLIGLVPDVPVEKVKFVGNTALAGAKMALISAEERETAEKLSKSIRYLELASDPDFQLEFAEAAFLPHKDLDRFPSLKKFLKKCK
ncbi:MAG: ASKHA domain-containing protein [Candidatus Bathyarchaeia archaeon]